mgnify:CR=1 FL=1
MILKTGPYNVGVCNSDRILRQSDKSEITSWGFPDSSRYEDLTLLESEKSYTHDVAGYYAISKKAGKQNAYVSMYSGGLGYTCASPNAQGHCVLSIEALSLIHISEPTRRS